MRALLLQVNLLYPLWHGSGEWPPSPFRLFQAMVAGAFSGRWVAEDKVTRERRAEAFRWLERQQAPDISAPPRSECRQITSFVPINDLDSVAGDPARIDEIRTEKVISPSQLEGSQEFLYAWSFKEGEAQAKLICELVERLHTFGRGVDPAWARGELVDPQTADALLRADGVVARPVGLSGENLLRCPVEGSLQSLILRHEATTRRFQQDPVSQRILFRQPPKPYYQRIAYDRRPIRLFFEIRQPENLRIFVPVPQVKASLLTEALREEVTRRLKNASQRYATLTERFVVGRGAGPGDLERRVRIIPLATIGHTQASPSIRRVGVEVPPDCPVSAQDVAWAFTGMSLSKETGFTFAPVSAMPAILVQSQSNQIAWHYGWDRNFKCWRSVTPVVLPTAPGRGPTAAERSLSEAQCAGAFANALRHAGITVPVTQVRIQREPFHRRGAVADTFASSRFGGRLRHVEVIFQSPVCGPLILGDGRFVGLGVMRPVSESIPGLHVFAVNEDNSPPTSRASAVARAFRRAVMARAQALYNHRELPLIFHGHEADSSPARGGHHDHLFYAAFSSEGGERLDRLAVIAPHLCDRSISVSKQLNNLARAVEGLRILHCGPDGVLNLKPLPSEVDQPYFGNGRVWTTVEAYRPTRHPRRNQPIPSFIERDIRTECARRSLPRLASVEFLSASEGVRGGLIVRLTIAFVQPLWGPLLLGRESHFGAGLFRLVSTPL